MAIEERQAKLEARKKKIAEFEATKKGDESPKTEEPQTQPKKKKQIIAEVSDSSSDEEQSSGGSDSDESVEVIVKRKPKTVVAKVSKKKPASKAKKAAPEVAPAPQADVSRLTAEVAKQLLKQKLIDENYNTAMRSLFPMHNF